MLDVCRFALVFDHAWDLTALLELICADMEVEVVGAKNRLQEDYDARLSAGFRDVHLNVRMTTPEAVRLGNDDSPRPCEGVSHVYSPRGNTRDIPHCEHSQLTEELSL